MKRIAIFVNDLGVGGIQKSVINMLNILDLNKYHIDLYLFDRNIFYQDMIPKKVNLFFLKRKNYIFKFIPFNLSFLLNKNDYFINKEEYDMAIDFDSYQFQTAYNTIKCPSKTKIMWIHNDVYNEKKYNLKYRILHYFMKGKYKYFDKFVGVSDGVIEPFKQLNRVSDKEFIVIPNLINTKEIKKLSLETVDDIKVDDSKYNIISVGRICHQKGYDIFLRYYKEIIKKRNDIHFYLIGDGNHKNKILRLVKKYNLNDYFTYIGKTSNPYKYEKLMDGFVLTSRYEGQGIAILEAKALGLDIFITKNIEKYNGYNIKGIDNIEEELINARKKEKVYDNLEKYNKNIINKINKLLDK